MRGIYYHSVLPASRLADFYATSALTADQLHAHAAELARNWTVLSLADVHDHLQGGRPLPARAVHISFDDGFRNNLTAADIFESFRLPWTLFAVSAAVVDGYIPWYVRLADALAVTTRPVTLDGVTYDLGTVGDKHRLKRRIKDEVMDAPAAEHVAVLSRRIAEAGLDEPPATAWPFLTPAELADLARRGAEIGNHTATHPNLVRCSNDALYAELCGSQQHLKAVIGTPVRFLSYPDGRFNRRVTAVAASSHDLAMATWTARKPLAPMQLRRFPVGPSVDDLLDVLSPDYPARYLFRRTQWAVRRGVRKSGLRRRPGHRTSSHA